VAIILIFQSILFALSDTETMPVEPSNFASWEKKTFGKRKWKRAPGADGLLNKRSDGKDPGRNLFAVFWNFPARGFASFKKIGTLSSLD
jgi:hypothetical protein